MHAKIHFVWHRELIQLLEDHTKPSTFTTPMRVWAPAVIVLAVFPKLRSKGLRIEKDMPARRCSLGLPAISLVSCSSLLDIASVSCVFVKMISAQPPSALHLPDTLSKKRWWSARSFFLFSLCLFSRLLFFFVSRVIHRLSDYVPPFVEIRATNLSTIHDQFLHLIGNVLIHLWILTQPYYSAWTKR